MLCQIIMRMWKSTRPFNFSFLYARINKLQLYILVYIRSHNHIHAILNKGICVYTVVLSRYELLIMMYETGEHWHQSKGTNGIQLFVWTNGQTQVKEDAMPWYCFRTVRCVPLIWNKHDAIFHNVLLRFCVWDLTCNIIYTSMVISCSSEFQ